MQDKLLIIRKTNGINQQTFAELLNITIKQYGFKERGITRFNGDEMFKISEYLSIPIEDIFLPTYHQNGENRIFKKNKGSE